MGSARAKYIEYYLPDHVLDNQQIAAEHPEWTIEKIAAKTGIFRRHIAAKDEFASDMAVRAALDLFSAHGIDPQSIDFILLCTQSPDYFLPTTACLVQDRLGLSKQCGALDFNLGCSGYIYGLGMAKGLIATKQAKNVLLITSETYTKFIHPSDKSNKTLFGDAAAATLVTGEEDGESLGGEILEFVYGTDGSGASSLIVKNGGARTNFVRNNLVEGLEPDGDDLYMDGGAIFEFTAFNVPKLVKDTLVKHELSMEEIDLFVFHQANQFMLNTIRKRAGIPEEKFFVYLEDCGNTVSSTIPIALREAMRQGRIKKGDKVLLAGFGVGLSMGATILQF
ncbi:3-oxoacyl-ACP synthase III family protein [Rufibacter glacialis]|uniref:3-oxoacyl-ACP synthase III family protein n=1 Tax=Rufibacter glacialis TaxID=1259555 RepID=A0A5M8Q8W6_9BACT|nr:ketoacyl-ACP synthase III [Rufibacter glacialis]KAA6432377.1 ketoacyl-ACP synthase III [Rufibacter glacialis]GGK78177.1 3-oxoacyl-ACP synthase [Rufibacter glacialis]